MCVWFFSGVVVVSKITFTDATEEQISAEYSRRSFNLRSKNIIAVADLLYENRDRELPIMEICFTTGLIRKKVIEVIGELKRRHGFVVNNSNYKSPSYQLLGFGRKMQRRSSVFDLIKPKLNPLIEKVFS